VQRLRQDAELRQRLARYISEHLRDIDGGVYQLPIEFLTTEALSYSTLGINRLANKPFDVIFPPDERVAIDVSITPELRWINSRDAVIDRLNNGSCLGCHQASTTAGFHFLGEDDPEISGVTNRLELPFSAHFHHELTRRGRQLIAIANQTEVDRFRPHSLLPSTKEVSTNKACVPERYRDDFQASALWSCSKEETCQVVVEEEGVGILFGQCLPQKGAVLAGNTCRAGKIISNVISEIAPFNLHAYADQFTHQQLYDLPEKKKFAFDSYNCRPTRIGVPLGRAYRKCTTAERSFASVDIQNIPSELCAVVGGSKFDSCVEKDFHSCLDSIVARGMVDSCHSNDFCREDYICQSLPYQLNGVNTTKGQEIADAGVGFCTPTYFVFQLRLDGHPVPSDN
jgi:hypothetical protein